MRTNAAYLAAFVLLVACSPQSCAGKAVLQLDGAGADANASPNDTATPVEDIDAPDDSAAQPDAGAPANDAANVNDLQADTLADANFDTALDITAMDMAIVATGTDPCGDYECIASAQGRIEVCPQSVAVPLAVEETLTAVARCGECSWLGVVLVGDPGFHVGAALNGGNSSPDAIIYGSTTVQHLSPGEVLYIWIGNKSAKLNAQAKMSVAYLPGYTENFSREMGWLLSLPVFVTAAQ